MDLVTDNKVVASFCWRGPKLTKAGFFLLELKSKKLAFLSRIELKLVVFSLKLAIFWTIWSKRGWGYSLGNFPSMWSFIVKLTTHKAFLCSSKINNT